MIAAEQDESAALNHGSRDRRPTIARFRAVMVVGL